MCREDLHGAFSLVEELALLKKEYFYRREYATIDNIRRYLLYSIAIACDPKAVAAVKAQEKPEKALGYACRN